MAPLKRERCRSGGFVPSFSSLAADSRRRAFIFAFFIVVRSNIFSAAASCIKGMTKKIWLLIAFAILLGGLSLYLNRDSFAKDNIQISHRSQPSRLALLRRKRAADDSAVEPVVFFFDRKLKLTCLKVIPLSAIETNKYPHPIWHIVSESNSVPTRDFV